MGNENCFELVVLWVKLQKMVEIQKREVLFGLVKVYVLKDLSYEGLIGWV